MKYWQILALFFVVNLSACATVSRGGTDYLRIDSVPQGATVTTTIETRASKVKSVKDPLALKQYRGCSPTPCLLKIGRRQGFALKIEHPGFEPAEIAIRGDIPMQTTNIDMAVPVGSIAANVGLGVTSGAIAGALAVSMSQAFTSILTLGTGTAQTGGIVAGATAAGAGIGLAVVGIDVASGAYSNIYPNPVIVKLAPEGTPTLTDPNMLMFKLREAKKHIAPNYCAGGVRTHDKRRKKNCVIAEEIDKKRDVENADLLAHEQEIKDMITKLKQELKDKKAAARAQKRSASN
jgi:hypothetical protein